MNNTKIKAIISDIAKYCVNTYQGYVDILTEQAEMLGFDG